MLKKVVVFDIGKHKDEQLVDVILKDPGYIDWLLKNIQGHKKEKAMIRKVKDELHNIFLKRVQEDTEYVNLKKS